MPFPVFSLNTINYETQILSTFFLIGSHPEKQRIRERRRSQTFKMMEGSLNCQNDEERSRRIKETEVNSPRDNDSSSTDTDCAMVTQLPDPILLHILLLLPSADAARTSVVSKSWLRIWNLLPVFNFSFRREFRRSASEQNVQNIQDFMKWISDSLCTLRAEKKAIIQNFVLELKFVEERSPSDDNIDGTNYLIFRAQLCVWIPLVLNYYIKHLKIIVPAITYSVPQAIFAAKSLITLHIEGCSVRIESSFLVDRVLFNYLRELTLSGVDVSKCSVEKILSSSPLLEKLTLREIGNMRSLKIHGLPKLNYVNVEQAIERRFEIEAPNLRTLLVHGPSQIYVSDCFKVKGSLFGDYEEKFVIEHPTLETMELCFYSCKRIKLLCAHLRTISLSNMGYQTPLDVEVNAPKLEQFNYEGYVFPSFCGMASSFKPSATLNLYLGGRPGLDVAVRNCIEKFNLPIVRLTYLYGQFFKAQEILWPGQVQESQVNSPPPKVKCLIWSLRSFTPSFAYPYLLDGSLCSCQPTILQVETLPNHRNFIKFILHELLNREENPSCCKDEPQFRCWRHYLEDVTVEIQNQSETEKPNPFQCNDLIEILKYIDTAKHNLQFRLKWSAH